MKLFTFYLVFLFSSLCFSKTLDLVCNDESDISFELKIEIKKNIFKIGNFNFKIFKITDKYIYASNINYSTLDSMVLNRDNGVFVRSILGVMCRPSENTDCTKTINHKLDKDLWSGTCKQKLL